MKSFWTMILVAMIGLSYSFSAKATPAEEAKPAGDSATTAVSTDPATHNDRDKMLTCEDAAKCAEAARKAVVKSARWVECIIPPEVKILSENGTYVTQKSPPPTWQMNQECVCPEGYSRSKSYRLRSKSEKDGKVYEQWDVAGVCLPLAVEPNAEVIADGLNYLRTFISRVELMALNTDKEVAGIKVTLGGHTEMIEYNRQEIAKLRADVDNLKVFMEGACSAPNLPANWKALCDKVDELDRQAYERQIFRLGAAGTYSRYPGRNYFGVALEGGWMTPRMSPESPLRLELGGRLGVGSAENMTEGGDAALSLEGTVYAGPVFDLDQKGQYKLHVRGMGQQLLLMDGFKAQGRRYGAEMAVSICPFAEARSQSSFCIVPHLNVTHGRSTFQMPETESIPAYNRGESNVTMGAGIGILGQF